MNAHRSSRRRRDTAGQGLALLLLGGVVAAVGVPYVNDHASQDTPSARPFTTGAPTLAARLKTADPDTTVPDYARSNFGPGLSRADPDGNGCQTREDVLRRDLTAVVPVDGCNVEQGVLADPYTGETIHYVEDVNPMTVQVDHIYALSEAWAHGAADWDQEKRVEFANDQDLNLVAVDGPANESKSDKGPGEWWPDNSGYKCTYARKYTQVAYHYHLTVTRDEKQALIHTLNECKEK